MADTLLSLQSLRRHLFVLTLSLICLSTFLIITLLSDRVFERVPHSEDEVAYLFQAKVFAQNRLSAPTPPLKQAFWTPFVVDYEGQRFGKYPPGWPFLLSFGVRLNWPWLVNAVLATCSLALVAWLGRVFYGRTSGAAIGLGAAGLGLVTPGFLFLSSSLLSHTASLFWSTLALTGVYYSIKRENSQPAFLAGLALGAAFVTRPFAGVGLGLAISFFLLGLMVTQKRHGRLLFWLALGMLPVAALLPLYWGAMLGKPTFNAYLLVWPYDRVGFGPDIGPQGYTVADAIFINTRLKLTALATGLFGWPGWSNPIFLFIPFLARQANRWDWLLLSTILGLIFIHTFYWAFGGTDGGFPRYYYDALPAFLLLTVRGIQISGELLGAMARSFGGGGLGRPLRWLPVGLVVIFIGYNIIRTLPALLAAQQGKYGITASQLEAVARADLSEPALIIVKNVEAWSDFAAPFAANSPTLDGPVVFASDEGPAMSQRLQTQFPNRTCWELEGEILKRCKDEEGTQ